MAVEGLTRFSALTFVTSMENIIIGSENNRVAVKVLRLLQHIPDKFNSEITSIARSENQYFRQRRISDPIMWIKIPHKLGHKFTLLMISCCS